MANRLKMAMAEAILALLAQGWSQRRVARELGINRETVGRYAALAPRQAALAASGAAQADSPGRLRADGVPPKPASKAPTGSGEAKPAKAPTGSEASVAPESAACSNSVDLSNGGFIALRPPAEDGTLAGAVAGDRATLGSDPSAAAAPNGTGGIREGAACFTLPAGRSQCEPFRQVIVGKLELGLSAQRIYQDLVTDHGYQDSYWSVRRFVAKVGQTLPLPMRRMECAPGDEAQVDFGTGAPVVDGDGHRRRPKVLRVVLSHSRKAYSEVVWREGTDEFLQCLENALWHFGGVPRTIIVDYVTGHIIPLMWPTAICGLPRLSCYPTSIT